MFYFWSEKEQKARQMSEHLQEMRENYRKAVLDREHMDADPVRQFAGWFEQAVSSGLPEPNAMTLATADAAGRPSARVVLLKGLEPEGFVFFTNYRSRKGRELADNPRAALVFFWMELERQVRIEGQVDRISDQASTAYFQSRPVGSQIGAWASPQSEAIPDRQYLEKRVSDLFLQYPGDEALPRPEHWGGYILVPDRIEFWQGREDRLHDRFEYQRLDDGRWEIFRLAP